MTNAGLQAERTHSEETESPSAVQLLSRTETHGELLLTISLYRIVLDGREFYAVMSCDGTDRDEGVAAEIVGREHRVAERRYRMLADGSVPPSTLREVVFDLCED